LIPGGGRRIRAVTRLAGLQAARPKAVLSILSGRPLMEVVQSLGAGPSLSAGCFNPAQNIG
jgi:hypothetical protein